MTITPHARGESARAAKTRATRQRILAAARELFVTRGYTATPVGAIAVRARTTPESVSFLFGAKRALLIALLDEVLPLGPKAASPPPWPWFRDALAAADPAQQIRFSAAGATVFFARAAALLNVARSAASTDREIAEAWRANVARRRLAHIRLAEALAAKHGLRPGLAIGTAADISHTLLSPEVYLALVSEGSWTNGQWRDWVADSLAQQLLTPANVPDCAEPTR